MTDVFIRPAYPKDAPVIVKNNLAMAKETENKRLDRSILETGVNEVFRNRQNGFYLLAEKDDRVVGQTLITYEWSDWRNGNFWWIQSVYVDPAERKSGIFRALYQHVLRTAQERPDIIGLRLYVHRDNQRAHEVYRSLGMNPAHYNMFEVDFSGRN
jgi:GNAT superfamily N-acetyltransferase